MIFYDPCLLFYSPGPESSSNRTEFYWLLWVNKPLSTENAAKERQAMVRKELLGTHKLFLVGYESFEEKYFCPPESLSLCIGLLENFRKSTK